MGSWTEVAGQLNSQTYIHGLITFNNKIYGCTTPGGRLFEWSFGNTVWTQVAPELNSQTQVYDLAIFHNELYAVALPGGRLFKWNGSNSWIQVAPYLNMNDLFCIKILNDRIYAGGHNGAHLYEWGIGYDNWIQVASGINGQNAIYDLCVFNGKLYGSTGQSGLLFEWNGSNAWTLVGDAAGSEINSLVVYKNELYGGTFNNGYLVKWNGVNTLTVVAGTYGGQQRIDNLVVYNNKLYGGSDPSGMLLEWNNENAWTLAAANFNGQVTIRCFAELNGRLYAGTGPGGRLFKWSGISFPSNFTITPGVEKNSSSWDEVSNADSYNLYWKKDKCPNCYFTNLDDWIITEDPSGTNTTHQIVSEKLLLDVELTQKEWVTCQYKYDLPNSNYELVINTNNYTPDAYAASWIKLAIENSDFTSKIELFFGKSAGVPYGIGGWVLNGGVYNSFGEYFPTVYPAKLKIIRTGTTFEVWFYTNLAWYKHGEHDFGVDASSLDKIRIKMDMGDAGASVEIDNLIITPSVKDSGTKISGITELTYDHESLESEHVYCYEITAEGSESEPSEEVYGIPEEILTPDPPTGISVVSGEELNTITFTADPEADETHIYWDTSPGFTPSPSQKLENVTSPKEHTGLNPSLTYYYILVSENEEGEGEYSIEYNSSPIPETPENVIATAGIEKNTITYDAAFGADSYNIYWKDNPGVTKINGTKITGVTSPHEHIDLTPGQPYYYVVTSEDEDGESSISSEVSGTPIEDVPDTPTNFEIIIIESGDSEIMLTWDAMESADYYDIYYSIYPNVTKEIGTKIGNITDTIYNHQNLSKNKYYYIIIAINETGESIVSNEINYTVLFEGKIFNHTEEIKNNLLYQYQGD